MSRNPKSKRQQYLKMRDHLFAGKKVAISVAHNAVSNREETASPAVNQIYSLAEMLEAGFGLEIDIHIGADGNLQVCHSPFNKRCIDPLLGSMSLSYVTQEIREFQLNNPQRSVFITVESHGNHKNLNQESKQELQDFLRLTLKTQAWDKPEFKEYSKELLKRDLTSFNFLISKCFTLDAFQKASGDGYDLDLFQNYEGYKSYKKIFEIDHDSQMIYRRNVDDFSPEEINEIIDELVDKSYQLVPHLQKSLVGAYRRHSIPEEIFNPEETLQQKNHYINLEVAYRLFDEVLVAARGRENRLISNINNNYRRDEDHFKLSPRVTIALEGGEEFRATCLNLLANYYVSPRHQDRDQVLLDEPQILANYYVKGALQQGAAATEFTPKIGNFFSELSANNTRSNQGFATVYENSLAFPFYSRLEPEVIEKLLEVGVNLFKFDYVAAGNEIDTRLLQVDLHNINKYLESDLLNNQEAPAWLLLRDLNLELSEKEQQHSMIPANSFVMAPFVGKPLAEISVACAAIGYLGLLQQEQQNFAGRNTEKYDPYSSFLLTALSVGALVFIDEMVKKKIVSFSPSFARGISASVGAADLFLYSQSVIPFGVALLTSMLSSKQSEVLGQQITTALPYAMSAFVRYSLDPQSSFQNTAINVAAALTGAVVAANALKLIGEKLELNSQKRE